MKTRSRKQGIVVNIDWDTIQNKPVIGAATFEELQAIGDIGTGADQVAPGDHDHDIGDVSLIFENSLV